MSKALNGIYDAIPVFDQSNRLCKGNIKARTRMIFLYYYANNQNRIVCGSSDKSETMMGYFTKWGDAAADIAPIMDLYKTQVRKLALHLGIAKELAVEKVLVDKVKSRWIANEHKRRMPLTPKIGYRTVGNDFRLPRHTY
jgi:NH3-dependent NAD+ synthetase